MDYLDVGSGFVGDFHQKLFRFGRFTTVEQHVQNIQIDRCSQIVNIRDETIFPALRSFKTIF